MIEQQSAALPVNEMIEEGHPEVSIAKLKLWLDEHETDAQAHYELGMLYFSTGQTDHAADSLQKCVDLNPENAEYLKNFGDALYAETKDASKALGLYEKVLAIHPDDIATLMISGHLRVSLKQFDAALVCYQRIVDIEPSNKEALKLIDQLNNMKKKSDAALIPENEYRRCQALIKDEKLDEAIACFTSIIQRYPRFALAYNDLGVLYYRLEDKKRCLECYEKAVLIDPENSNYRKNLADFYLVEQGRMEDAMEIYLSVLQDNPEDIDVLLVAGHMCVALGKIDSARTFYERVLDLEPWNFDANERLEKLETE